MLAERHKVPGASLGILRIHSADGSTGGRPDELVEAAYGFANAPARVEATTDTLFQIGSISKVWTATVAMQLVDEGKLDLDAPVVEVLPELQLADAEVTKTVTMRQLLTHTSGIDGDVFTDTGRGDDCVEKYVGLMSEQSSRTTRAAPPGPTATPASRSPGGSSRSSPGSPGTPRCGRSSSHRSGWGTR